MRPHWSAGPPRLSRTGYSSSSSMTAPVVPSFSSNRVTEATRFPVTARPLPEPMRTMIRRRLPRGHTGTQQLFVVKNHRHGPSAYDTACRGIQLVVGSSVSWDPVCRGILGIVGKPWPCLRYSLSWDLVCRGIFGTAGRAISHEKGGPAIRVER